MLFLAAGVPGSVSPPFSALVAILKRLTPGKFCSGDYPLNLARSPFYIADAYCDSLLWLDAVTDAMSFSSLATL